MNENGEEKQYDIPKLDETLRQRLEGLVPEVIKRTFYAGLGAVFTTEEGIRRVANEFSLPKDVARVLVQQAQSTKDELFRIVAGELRGFLESLNLNEELQRLLTSLSFEIKTEIRFIPNEAKVVKPNLKNRVSVKRKGAGRTKPSDPGPELGLEPEPEEEEEAKEEAVEQVLDPPPQEPAGTGD
jgi:hypothetical protein